MACVKVYRPDHQSGDKPGLEAVRKDEKLFAETLDEHFRNVYPRLRFIDNHPEMAAVIPIQVTVGLIKKIAEPAVAVHEELADLGTVQMNDEEFFLVNHPVDRFYPVEFPQDFENHLLLMSFKTIKAQNDGRIPREGDLGPVDDFAHEKVKLEGILADDFTDQADKGFFNFIILVKGKSDIILYDIIQTHHLRHYMPGQWFLWLNLGINEHRDDDWTLVNGLENHPGDLIA
jgi:hypothetical protein